MQLFAQVSGLVSQIVGPQKHIGGTSRFCFSIFSLRFLFRASKKLTQNNTTQHSLASSCCLFTIMSAYQEDPCQNQQHFDS